MKLSINSSPFKRAPLTTADMMGWVALACLPGLFIQCYLFSFGPLIQVGLTIFTAMLAEALVMILRRRPVFQALGDQSAMLTGLLLGLSLPAYAPWWVAVLGAAFAIIMVKQLYGGLGHNLFNPAMAAYVFLLISFPLSMTSWTPPVVIIDQIIDFPDSVALIFTGFSVDGFSLHQMSVGIDGITQATPLDTLRSGLAQGLTSSEVVENNSLFQLGHLGWQWINVAYLAGGLMLIQRGIIYWHIPLAFLCTLLVLSIVGYSIAPDQVATPMIHLFNGATMFGAFFILTDPVSASTTPRGRIIYAILIGILVYLIRSLGGYPDAVAFAVLLANMCVPLIDQYSQPKVYGYKKGKGND